MAHAFKVDRLEKVVESLSFLVQLHKELLGVAAGLSARASAYMLLDTLPLLAVLLQGFDKSKVFVKVPPASFLGVGVSATREGSV